MGGGLEPSFPDGWTVAGPLVVKADVGPTLTLDADIDARTPRPVTFAVTFKDDPQHRRYILLAVVTSAPDPITAAGITGANLKDLILNNHQFAARVVEVKP